MAVPDSNAEARDASTAVAAAGPGGQVPGLATRPAPRREREAGRPRAARGRPRRAGWLVVAVPAVTAFLVAGY